MLFSRVTTESERQQGALMGKGSGKKKKSKNADRSAAAAAGSAAAGGDKPVKRPKIPKVPKVAKAVSGARAAVSKIGDNPVVAEVVAAALVATAAALRNPKQARRMASDAAGELEGAIQEGGQKTSAFWQLALDVARRSIETLEAEAKSTASKKKRS